MNSLREQKALTRISVLKPVERGWWGEGRVQRAEGGREGHYKIQNRKYSRNFGARSPGSYGNLISWQGIQKTFNSGC